MIEMLIEAERALTHGLIDQAERLYAQVAANDPRSSIAVMGLARVALERGDDRTAYSHARTALAIDADNPAAQHLVMRLEEVMAGRGETPPDVQATVPDASAKPPAVSGPATRASAPARATRAPTTRPPSLIGRLLRRGRKPR
jgi:uncharacterized protein HemY